MMRYTRLRSSTSRVQALLRVLAWACGLLLLGPLPVAHAGADCSITTAGLAFGLYDAAATLPDDNATTITVTCVYVPPGATKVSYSVSASPGLFATSALNRRMGAGPGRLSYNIFGDPARTQVFGTGTGGTVVASGSMTVGPGVGNGTRTASHVIYGRVPPLQDADAGAYLDSLVLTLDY
jgi:spore coat protein U-like protein